MLHTLKIKVRPIDKEVRVLTIKIGVLNPNGLEISTQHALEELEKQLTNQALKVHYAFYTEGIPKADLLIGTYQKSAIIKDLTDRGLIPLPTSPEGLTIHEMEVEGRTSLWACGYDARGLDYALYELAERAGAQSLLALHNPIAEKPELAIRRVCAFFTNLALEKNRFFDPKYWEAYFSLLAKSRVNSFALIFGAPGSPLTPLFPYILEVPEHPEVMVEGLTAQDRMKNKEALYTAAAIASDYGIEFILGLQQIQAGRDRSRNRALGLTNENLESYTYLALAQLLSEAPKISGIHLRCTKESGIPLPEKNDFLLDLFLRLLSNQNKRLLLSKSDLPSETLAIIEKSGLPVEISIDYRPEGGGTLPYQPARDFYKPTFTWQEKEDELKDRPLLKLDRKSVV